MPGTNAGTGQPLTLKCAKCKKIPVWFTTSQGKRDWHAKSGEIVRTGRVRGEDPGRFRHGRMLHQHHEYECLECGHVGWTRHKQILMKPLKGEISGEEKEPR